MVKDIQIIVAADADNGIGKDGKLPWHLPGDLKFFRRVTSSTEDLSKMNAVVMGRKTWESIPEKFRPLPERVNIVLSQNRELSLPADVFRASSFDEIFALIETPPLIDVVEKIFVIGGAQIYKEAIKKEECTKLYVTQILSSFQCDTFFPNYRIDFDRKTISTPQKEGEITYYFSEYHRSKRESHLTS